MTLGLEAASARPFIRAADVDVSRVSARNVVYCKHRRYYKRAAFERR